MPLTELERTSGAEMAVTLINSWDEYDSEHEYLRDADVLRRWLRGNGFPRAADAVSDEDVQRARELRSRLTAAFDAATQTEAVEALNALVAESGTPPQLELAARSWGFRSWRDEGEGLGFLASYAALGLLEVIRDGGWERFGRCVGSPCRCVYIDRSRNRSRRFCSQLCADRVAQADYRRRRRSTGPARR
jgi:predicted RNA-binding Zn ribbon-like protein